jgi:hypothetical protein
MMLGPKSEVAFHEWSGLSQEMAPERLGVFEDPTGVGARSEE